MGCWGLRLFQSDADLQTITQLENELGLEDIEIEDVEAACAEGKMVKTWYVYEDEFEPGNIVHMVTSSGSRFVGTCLNTRPAIRNKQYGRFPKSDHLPADAVEIHYSIYAPHCTNIERVREYLDGGKLEEMFAEKEKLAIEGGGDLPGEFGHRNRFVILGACAMSLGCKIRPHIRQMLKKYFKDASLAQEADEQMEAALIAPANKLYKSGEPYHFDSPSLITTLDKAAKDGTGPGVNIQIGGMFNVPKRKSPRKLENHGLFCAGAFGADRCAGCGVAGSATSSLLQCGKCRTTKYCDKECQKQHWKFHKEVCTVGGTKVKMGTKTAMTTSGGRVMHLFDDRDGDPAIAEEFIRKTFGSKK